MIKTAISLNKDLFEKAKRLANEMNIPRSKLFQYALANYIEQCENKRILEKLNEVYSEELTPEEKKLQKLMKNYHKKISKNKW